MILLSAAGLVLMISQIVWASESPVPGCCGRKSCRGECRVTSKGAYPPTGYKQCAKEFEPTFRISCSAESYFGGPLDVFYNLLTIRGDWYARPTHVPSPSLGSPRPCGWHVRRTRRYPTDASRTLGRLQRPSACGTRLSIYESPELAGCIARSQKARTHHGAVNGDHRVLVGVCGLRISHTPSAQRPCGDMSRPKR